MRKAKQADIDAFMDAAFTDPDIYPWLTHSNYTDNCTERVNDWEGLHLTDERNSYLLTINFGRTRKEIEFSIALFAKGPVAAGRGILALKEMVKRYRPFSISCTVAISNAKSYEITKKILGDPWGMEPLAHYNQLTGKREDIAHFKKIINEV